MVNIKICNVAICNQTMKLITNLLFWLLKLLRRNDHHHISINYLQDKEEFYERYNGWNNFFSNFHF